MGFQDGCGAESTAGWRDGSEEADGTAGTLGRGWGIWRGPERWGFLLN